MTQYIILALENAIERGLIDESEVTQERLEQFLGGFGRQFYKIPATSNQKIVLKRRSERIPDSIKSEDGTIEVALSRAGDEVFSLEWKMAV